METQDHVKDIDSDNGFDNDVIEDMHKEKGLSQKGNKMVSPAVHYQLSSVVLHIGSKASGGHYTAYARDSLNQVRNCVC